MGVPSVNINGKLVEDSAFALGRSMVISKPHGLSETKIPSPGKMGIEVLKMLSMNEALMLNSLVHLLDNYRKKINHLLTKLFNKGLVKIVSVTTEHATFALWLPMDTRSPRNAQEACRLAMLGSFMASAMKEMPDFQWRLIRNNKSPVLAEMTFTGKYGKEKWIIDAPRRGEKPQEKAHLYVFPTLEEAVSLAPEGRKFTSDVLLLKNPDKALHEKIKILTHTT